MKSTTGNRVLFGAIVLLALTAVFVFASSSLTNQKPAQTNSTGSETIPLVTITPTVTPSLTFSIVYLTKEGTNTKIITVKEDGSEPKTLYNDATDSDKFKAPAGMRNDGSSIYLLIAPVAQEFSGKLVAISTDGKAKVTILREDIKYTTPPQVSPIGDKIALINFSNDEKNFGFTVNLESLDGKDSKTIYSSQETISLIDFSTDGSKIAMVKSTGQGGSQVVVADLAKNTSSAVYSTSGTILSLDYESNGIILTEAPAGQGQANNADVVRVDTDGKNVTKLTINTLAENTIRFDPNNKQAAYIQLQYSDGVAVPGVSGNLVKLNLQDKKESVIGKSTGVIGWLR